MNIWKYYEFYYASYLDQFGRLHRFTSEDRMRAITLCLRSVFNNINERLNEFH